MNQKLICPGGHIWVPSEPEFRLSIDPLTMCPVCGLEGRSVLEGEGVAEQDSPPNGPIPENPAILVAAERFPSNSPAITPIKSGPQEKTILIPSKPVFRYLCLLGIGLLGILLISANFLGCFDHGIYWVGAQDLEITFLVTDLETGLSLKGAKLEISGEAHFCDEGKEVAPFHLVTGADGIARSFHKNCMCYGANGWLDGRPTDTFAMHIPHFEVRVSIPGYGVKGISLDESRRKVERGKENEPARLEVPIGLKKLKKR